MIHKGLGVHVSPQLNSLQMQDGNKSKASGCFEIHRDFQIILDLLVRWSESLWKSHQLYLLENVEGSLKKVLSMTWSHDQNSGKKSWGLNF